MEVLIRSLGKIYDSKDFVGRWRDPFFWGGEKKVCVKTSTELTIKKFVVMIKYLS